MITTPSMGLKRWDQPNDVFSYTELSDNFNLIDNHDHTSGKGVQIPTAGIANNAVDNTKIANNAVTAAKIPDTTLTDTKLVSPNNGIPRVILTTNGVMNGMTPGTYLPRYNGAPSAPTTPFMTIPSLVYIAASTYSVGSKVTTPQLDIQFYTSGTAATTSFTFGLYPITSVTGTGSGETYTLGAIVSGSAVTFTTPAASSMLQSSAAFTLPPDGFYAIGLVVTGSMAAGSVIVFHGQLRVRHV